MLGSILTNYGVEGGTWMNSGREIKKKKKIWQYWSSALGGTESRSSLSEAERERGAEQSRAELSYRAGILDWSVVVWERKARRDESAKGRQSHREDMAEVSEVLMSVLSTIRVPRPGDRVHKDECALSFASPVSLFLHTHFTSLHSVHSYTGRLTPCLSLRTGFPLNRQVRLVLLQRFTS